MKSSNFLKDNSIVKKFKNFYLEEPIVTGKPTHNIFKNIYLRGVVYILACFLTTIIYYGWVKFQIMFYRNNAYEWLCTSEELANVELYNEKSYYCDQQYAAVQRLYTVAVSSEFAFSVVAGSAYDLLGPLTSSFIGNIMYFLSWIILTYSTQKFQGYIFAMILMGCSVNMVAYPCLELQEYFPKLKQLAASLVISAQTGASLVAPLLFEVWEANPTWTFKTIAWGYLGFIWLPIFIFSMLTHPVKRLCKMKEDQLLLNEFTDVSEKAIENTKSQQIESVSEKNKKAELFEFIKNHKVTKDIISWKYYLFLLYYVTAITAHGYYPTIVQANFTNEVGDFQGWFYPTQIFWGAFIGIFVDFTGTLVICQILTVSYIVASVAAFSNEADMQYFSSVVFLVSNAYIYTVKYTYVVEYFSRENLGRLVGIIGCLSGVFNLLNTVFEDPFYDYKKVLYGFIGAHIGLAILLAFLMVATAAHKKSSLVDKVQSKNRSVNSFEVESGV